MSTEEIDSDGGLSEYEVRGPDGQKTMVRATHEETARNRAANQWNCDPADIEATNA